MKLLDYSYYDKTLQKIFIKNLWLKEKLISEGYATNLSDKHNYLLTPGIFNNFYKAAISEKIFDLVAKHYDLDVHSMADLSHDEFEKMDGYLLTNDGKILYIDMKNYNAERATKYDTKSNFTKKEYSKLAGMQGNSVAIINFYNWSGKPYVSQRITDSVDNEAIYVYPALFNNDGSINEEVINDLSLASNRGK